MRVGEFPYMKCADAGIDEADSKERARGSCGMEGSLLDGDEVSTLRITIILAHEAQGTSTCTHKPHPLDTPILIATNLW